MIDIKKLRKDPKLYKKACEQKGCVIDVDKLLEREKGLRMSKDSLQRIATEKNRIGKVIAQTDDPIEREKNIKEMALKKQLEIEYKKTIAKLEPQIKEMLLNMPLPAHPEAPVGPDVLVKRRWDHFVAGKCSVKAL